MGSHATGRGAGKLILCGEHAVVYGMPALAMAIDRGTTVTLTPHEGATRAVDCPWADAKLQAALQAVLPLDGLAVRITSDLPVGRGMGSSAALAVALVRAEAARTGEVLDADAVFARAFAVERVFHGTPSGLDHAVSARGGVLRYVRGDPPSFTALPAPPWQLVVLDSGEAGDTATLVAGVRARHPGNQHLIDAIGALTEKVIASLEDLATVGPLLTRNHRLLADLGVSNPTLDALVELALGAGAAGAKLSGAGGGGVVIAAVEDPTHLLGVATRLGIAALPVTGVP